MYNQKPLLGTLPNYAHPLTPNVGAWLFNEGSGLKAFDIIGRNHGNFGAGTAAPTWKTGRMGSALDFDSIDDYINCGNNVNWNTDAITVGIWINPTSGWDNYATCLYEKSRLRFTHSSNQFVVIFHDGTNLRMQKSSGSELIVNDVWNYLTMAYNKSIDSNLHLFINGLETDYAATSGWTYEEGTDNLDIGRKSNNTGHFLGLADYLTIHNRTLNVNEIWQLYVNPYCWLAQPMEAELMYATPPVGLSIPVAYHHYEALRVC